MKRTLALLAVVALVAAPASAQGLRLFFDTDGSVPTNGLANQNLEFPFGWGGTVYLWAEMVNPGGQVAYNAVGFNIQAAGDVQIQGGTLYNSMLPSYTNRWDSVNYTGSYPTTYAKTYKPFYVGTMSPPRGVTNVYGTADVDYYTDGAREFVRMGEFQIQEVAGSALYLQVGDLAIVRATAGVAEPVYFGFGDEGDGLMGNSFNQNSSIPEITFTPEPASLLLLGLGALALRRR
ncbi:MAG: PEP-CTERM sorting domain-containing protein [Planctomycetes bacterium]|nr:PEP-CTERM sorting domain-containing protein [Planctomycetota bacterium]